MYLFSKQQVLPTDMLNTHVQGVLCHNHDALTTYVDINEYPHDANMVISTLLSQLVRTATILVSASFLYLQMPVSYEKVK